MSLYVVKRVEDSKYVTTPGSEHSYTPMLQKARTWSSREAAQDNCCGNEVARSVEEEMQSAVFDC